jgi:hypothetical protein
MPTSRPTAALMTSWRVAAICRRWRTSRAVADHAARAHRHRQVASPGFDVLVDDLRPQGAGSHVPTWASGPCTMIVGR